MEKLSICYSEKIATFVQPYLCRQPLLTGPPMSKRSRNNVASVPRKEVNNVYSINIIDKEPATKRCATVALEFKNGCMNGSA